MSDTQRAVSTILALLADNSTGAISAQDLRDAFVSWRMGHGQLHVASPGAEITINTVDTYEEMTAPTWVETTTPAGHLWDETSNGRLYYTGASPMVCHVAFSFSMSAVASNKVWGLAIGKNGTADVASELHRKISTGGDVGAAACHLITQVQNGDFLSTFVKNTTDATNCTLVTANLQVVSMIA